jgi:hypothetical protein
MQYCTMATARVSSHHPPIGCQYWRVRGGARRNRRCRGRSGSAIGWRSDHDGLLRPKGFIRWCRHARACLDEAPFGHVFLDALAKGDLAVDLVLPAFETAQSLLALYTRAAYGDAQCGTRDQAEGSERPGYGEVESCRLAQIGVGGSRGPRTSGCSKADDANGRSAAHANEQRVACALLGRQAFQRLCRTESLPGGQ